MPILRAVPCLMLCSRMDIDALTLLCQSMWQSTLHGFVKNPHNKYNEVASIRYHHDLTPSAAALASQRL